MSELTAPAPANLDPSNAEQVESWNGSGGEYWATHADMYERSGGAYLPALLAAAGIVDGDAVVDIGCGTGATTRAAAAQTSGDVLGLDVSGPMLAEARRRAADLPNVRFLHADAQAHPFPGGADVVLSRFGVMFFGDPVAAFRNIRTALQPGGRLAMAVWQQPEVNPWAGVVAEAFAAGRPLPTPPPEAPGPFSLGDPERCRAVLAAAGWTSVELAAESHPMWRGPDVPSATAFLVGAAGWMLEGLDDAQRAAAIDDLSDRLAADVTPEGVCSASAAWIVTARA